MPLTSAYSCAALDKNWKGDIFVCTPPKCGATWAITIVTMLAQARTDIAPQELVQWVDAEVIRINDTVDALAAQTHRRCIKSHTPFDGVPWYSNAAYIAVYRHSIDVLFSLGKHLAEVYPFLACGQSESSPFQVYRSNYPLGSHPIDQAIFPDFFQVRARLFWISEFQALGGSKPSSRLASRRISSMSRMPSLPLSSLSIIACRRASTFYSCSSNNRNPWRITSLAEP
ncbi:MAG: hypothetical protein ACI8UP_002778 [Porticoccaceae bacterium]|jgi:hypothetical protein